MRESRVFPPPPKQAAELVFLDSGFATVKITFPFPSLRVHGGEVFGNDGKHISEQDSTSVPLRVVVLSALVPVPWTMIAFFAEVLEMDPTGKRAVMSLVGSTPMTMRCPLATLLTFAKRESATKLASNRRARRGSGSSFAMKERYLVCSAFIRHHGCCYLIQVIITFTKPYSLILAC